MEHGKQLVKNTLILTIGTLCTKVLAFIVIPLFSRWLSSEEYGLYDLYNTYVTLAIPVVTLSCGEAVFRFLLDDNDSQQRRKIVTNGSFIVLAGLSLATIVVVFFPGLEGNVKVAFLVFLISEVINSFLLSYVRGVKKLKIYACAGVLVIITATIFVTLFVYVLDMGLSGILFGYACAYTVSGIYVALAGRFYEYISIMSISRETLKKLVGYSAPLIPNTVSWWIMNVSDRTIINWVLDSNLLGIYSIANTIPSVCSTMFGVFQHSWQQSVSETIDEKGIEVFYNKVFNQLLVGISSICIAVLSVNFIFFDYIFDEKYSQGYYYVGILVLSTMLASVAAYLGGIFIGKKDTKKNGGTTVITAATNVVIHLLLIPYIGIYAASISTLVAYVVLVLIRWSMVEKWVKLRLDRKSILTLLCFFYFFVLQWFKNHWITYFNVLLAGILFCVINGNVLRMVYNKVFKRTT